MKFSFHEAFSLSVFFFLKSLLLQHFLVAWSSLSPVQRSTVLSVLVDTVQKKKKKRGGSAWLPLKMQSTSRNHEPHASKTRKAIRGSKATNDYKEAPKIVEAHKERTCRLARMMCIIYLM